MKRTLLIIGVLLSSCLMISVVTAIPLTHSKPVMDSIQNIEERRTSLKEKIFESTIFDAYPNGIIDLIMQLILLIIQLVLNLIEIIQDLIDIVGLIEYLINLIGVLIDAFFSLIQAIIDLFTPSEMLC